jgi:hypothetical protein
MGQIVGLFQLHVLVAAEYELNHPVTKNASEISLGNLSSSVQCEDANLVLYQNYKCM